MNTPWFNYFLSELRSFKALYPWWDERGGQTDAATEHQNYLMDAMVAGLASGYLDHPDLAQQCLHMLLDPQKAGHNTVLQTFTEEDRVPTHVITSLAFCYSPLAPLLPFPQRFKPSEVFHTLQAYDIPPSKGVNCEPVPLGVSLFHSRPGYWSAFHPADFLDPVDTLFQRFRKYLAKDPEYEYDRSHLMLAIYFNPHTFLRTDIDTEIRQNVLDSLTSHYPHRFPEDVFTVPPTFVYRWEFTSFSQPNLPPPPHDAPEHVLIDYIRRSVT